MMVRMALFAALLTAGGTSIAQEPAPIQLGNDGSGNACTGGNWQIVGFSSYEECIEVLGPESDIPYPNEPSGKDPRF
ncbi:MAG: hypothetical protein PGN21_09115 [Sphingomonas paucimobilis]